MNHSRFVYLIIAVVGCLSLFIPTVQPASASYHKDELQEKSLRSLQISNVPSADMQSANVLSWSSDSVGTVPQVWRLGVGADHAMDRLRSRR